jgi:hypothetical protein
MKLGNIIHETIANRPRSMAYFENRAKQLHALSAMFKQVSVLLKGKFPDYEIDKVINSQYMDENGYHTQKHPISSYQIIELAHTFGSEHGPFDTGRLADTLDSFVKYANEPAHDFFRYIPESLKWLNEQLEHTHALEVLQQIPNYQQLQQLITTDTDWALLNPEYHDAEDIQQVQNFLEAIRILNIAVPQYLTTINDLTEKVDAYQQLRTSGYSYNPHNWRPSHDEVETLYHTSAYANEIVQSGFAAEPPAERRGVGNLGFQNEISFTHDLKVAMDIARALKELTMIANGQLKARQIADWIRRENIPNFPWQEFMKVNSGSNQYGMPQYADTTFDQFSIVQTAKLYEKYIWFSKIHPNPVFISIGDLVNSLVGRQPQQTGILACQVRLDPQQSTYHPGESEFRVNPASVQSIKRII